MQMFQGTQLFSVEVGGRTLAIESGLLAPQAGGAVTVRYGDTVLLATAVMSKDVRPCLNFFPLTVEFEERLYAAGRIPGSFFRREGKPSEQAILMSRLVDRPLRPLFPKGMRNEVQVIVTAIATDGQNLMDPLAIIAGSAALAISDIPWNGPIAGTTIGFVDGEFVVNPTAAQMEASGLSLVAAGTEDNILMVEAGANELPEDLVLDALHLAHETNRKVIAKIQELRAALGKAKSSPTIFLPAAEVKTEVDTLVAPRMAALLAQGLGKVELNSGLDAIQADLRAAFAQRITDGTVAVLDVEDSYEATLKKITRRRILENGIRPDGRTTTQIRPISVQVGNLPRVHGSGLFMRGETHVLTVATLGTPGDAQRLDSLLPGEEKRYMHHYNFPPFSTGEATPMRGPKRREIGHGALAERALVPVIPEDFPYTLRLVSEVLSSNGSTSMGSVCGSTLALMDAGVPITAPVAGIAMGLI
ncbi:MAG: polyribonucleotide nucleotidyltransferase, partial [Caldilinea sp.]